MAGERAATHGPSALPAAGEGEIAVAGSRIALVVLGMHRSGTSALARILSLLGASLPENLMPPQADNPLGFWESSRISDFNEAALHQARRRWDDPKPIPDAWFYRSDGRELVDRAVELIRQEFGDRRTLVLKDPRISRLLPIWNEAFRRCQIAPHFLLMLRNPKEVAYSLRSRSPMPLEQAQLLWASYTLAAERGSRRAPRQVVDYETLLRDWRAALAGVPGLGPVEPVAASVDEFLSDSHRHYRVSADELQRDPDYSDLVKALYRCLAEAARGRLDEGELDRIRGRYLAAWGILSPGRRRARLFGDFPASGGAGRVADAPAAVEREGGGEAPGPGEGRHLVLHYHLFKNAGTSIDRFLQQNFTNRWCSREGEDGPWPATEVARFIASQPDLLALSSHTAQLPLPQLKDLTVLPIIFLRHPLDRIQSVYRFERRQEADTEGAIKAKQMGLGEFIDWRLERPGDRSFRNFQTYRLAGGADQRLRRTLGELGCAERTLAELPFVGLVEAFDRSMERLVTWLKPYFPDIAYTPLPPQNVTRAEGTTLEDRLLAFEEEIGGERYERLVAGNELDLALYRRVLVTYS